MAVYGLCKARLNLRQTPVRQGADDVRGISFCKLDGARMLVLLGDVRGYGKLQQSAQGPVAERDVMARLHDKPAWAECAEGVRRAVPLRRHPRHNTRRIRLRSTLRPARRRPNGVNAA